MFIHTGDYIEQVSNDFSHSTYYTFTPRLLMDGGFYAMGDDLATLLASAHRTIGILEGILLAFPESESFSELMLLKESCFNKMIDIPSIDFRSVLLNRGFGKLDDDVNNIVSAYQRVLGTNIHKANCNDIARCALHGSESKQKVSTRATPMFLSKSISNYRQYNPTAPADINRSMNDINRYIELDGIDPIIKAAMHHYQFEMVHPYERYNGVVGRILIYKVLHDAGLNGVRYASLSECLYHRKAEYFEKLGLTQKNGTYSAWIDFFIRAIGESAQNGIDLAKSYIDLIRSDNEQLSTYRDKKRHIVDIYGHFKKTVVSSIGQASEQLNLSFNAVSREVEILQSLGILTQVTSKSRNRLFSHAGLMRLLLPEQD